MTTLRETITEHVAEAVRHALTAATEGQGPIDLAIVGLGYQVHVIIAPLSDGLAERLDAPCSDAGWLTRTSEAPAID